MASVDWQKIPVGSARKLGVHMDPEMRKACRTHSNTNIDPEKSDLNYCLGCSSWEESVRRLEERTKEVDAVLPPQRIRKDRVTGVLLELPCPLELSDQGKDHEFFEAALKGLSDALGRENIHGVYVHKDEQHTYLDSKTREQRRSLVHAHVLVSPYVAGKGINGKAFVTRSRMRQVNRIMEGICRGYGLEWHTGQGKDARTMEQLKADSAKAERQRQEELILEPERVEEIQQKRPLFGKDEVIIRAEDLARLQETAAMAQPALDKAKRLQDERYRLRADLEAERRRAPELIREAEEQAEQEAARIRERAAAEVQQMRQRQEALKAAIERLDGLLEEKQKALSSPDKAVLKIREMLSEIEAQGRRCWQARDMDTLVRHGAAVERLLHAARETWRDVVPEQYRSPELEAHQTHRYRDRSAFER